MMIQCTGVSEDLAEAQAADQGAEDRKGRRQALGGDPPVHLPPWR